MKTISTNPFPTKEQEVLLKAALFRAEEAVSAWHDWNKLVDFDGYFDHGSFRLMPLVYKNLSTISNELPHIGRLKNIYLQSWYKNQKLFYDCSKIILDFEENQIKTLILKGVPLSIFAYKDSGVRPMSDIDLLVPRNKAVLAMDLLRSKGWKAENEEYVEYNLKYGRSMMFKRPDGFELDIHWCPFFEAHGYSSESDFWDKAISFKISEVSTLSLCPADMLLLTIVHGLRWNPEPPIRWIPDSIKLITTCEIDWPYFIEQTKKYHLVIQIRKAFDYLINTFNLSLPENTIASISHLKITITEKLIFREAQKNEEEVEGHFFKKIYKLFLIYLRQSNDSGMFRQMAGFYEFLRFRTKGKNVLAILWYYLKKH